MVMSKKEFAELKKLSVPRKEFERDVEKVTGKKYKDIPKIRISSFEDLRIGILS